MRKTYIIIIIFLINYHSTNAQHDSDTLINILLIWNLEDNFNKKQIQLSDSSTETFHKTSEEEKSSILTSNLGNFGSANISDIFINRDDKFNRDFSFNFPYSIYIKNSKNVKYFNTRRPFTSIMHTTSSKLRNLQTINFIHSQNINPNFNVAVNFDFMNSTGQFNSQETKANSSGLSLNYKKNKYSIHASYVDNKINNQNSGGYIDTLGSDEVVPAAFMENAGILLKNQELSATQKYKFGTYKNLSYRDTIIKVLEPSVSISHNINLYRKYRVYSDAEIAGSKLYSDFNYQEGITEDSTSLKGISNKFRFGSEKIFEEKMNFGFSIIYEADIKEYFNFKEYILLQNKTAFFENNVSGELNVKKFENSDIKLFSKYYFSGYRKNDLRTGLNIRKNIIAFKIPLDINLNTVFTNFKNDFYIANFYSNHYIWENEFEKTQRYDASINVTSKNPDFHISFYGSIIKNYIFYGPVKEPLQFDSAIYVLTGNLNKTFKLNKLYIANDLYWQKSSNDNVISIPQFSAYHSAYLKYKYGNSLLAYLGYDLYYSTKYKALTFSSSVGQFYFENNSSQIIGNYPFVGIFLNMKIKKNVLLSLKLQHVNSGLLNEKYPVQINHYPVSGRLFKFAIRWTFKN